MQSKINVIITGATGMVGEGVLHECILSDKVEKILVVGRKPCGVTNSKLTEIIHGDFYNFSEVENSLSGYDACFFCLGKSSLGMNEDDYTKVTYKLTMTFAKTLSKLNKELTFCYVSGTGTDGSEKGKIMWARVKGKTENDLRNLPYKKAIAFRPGYMHPTHGLKNTLGFYKYIGWIYPIGRKLFPNHFSTLKELGIAMINSVINGSELDVLEVRDINKLAE